MSYKLFDDIVNNLSASRRSIRCAELAAQLRQLGFDVRDGKQGGHKLVFHDGIPDFISSSYDCGHGRNSEIKLAYVVKILKLLATHKKEIIDHLEKKQEKKHES